MSTGLRIAFISIGGHIHTERWLRYFVERGHEVHLIAIDPVPMDGVTVHHLHTGIPWKPLHYGVGILALRRILSRIQPDILHTHFLQGHGYWSIFAGVRPHVLTVWGDDVYEAPYKSWLRGWLSRKALARADIITGDSSDILNAVEDLGAPRFKLRLILWGVDFEKFQPGDPSIFRKRWNVPNDALVVFSPRSFSRPYYNIDTILEMTPALLKEIPNAVVVFAAYDGDGAPVRREAERLGVESSVRVVERIEHDEMPGALSAADLVVTVPSVDATSVSLLEAMACARPVVASDLASNREWVTDGENGLIVRPRDVASLTEACARLCRDAEMRKEFGDRSLTIARERADYRENMAHMEEICLRLVDRYRAVR